MSKKELFELKVECSRQAQEYIEQKIIRNYPSILHSERFIYSEKLNTCLVYFEIREKGVGTTYNIMDTLKDEKIYYYIKWDDYKKQEDYLNEHCSIVEGCFKDEKDFDKKLEELFN